MSLVNGAHTLVSSLLAMALSLYWPGRYFFYPIGNTSAVDLTRDISPDAPADLLLNPVGDARNVLYTLYCQDDHGESFFFEGILLHS